MSRVNKTLSFDRNIVCKNIVCDVGPKKLLFYIVYQKNY